MAGLALSCMSLATQSAQAGAEECRTPSQVIDRTVYIDVTPDRVLPKLPNALTCAANMAEGGTVHAFVIRLAPGEYRVDTPIEYPDVLRKRRATLTIKGENAILVGSQSLKIESQEPTGENNRVRTHLPPSLAALAVRGWVRNHGQFPEQAPPELIVNHQIFQAAREPNSGFISAIPMVSDRRHLIVSSPEKRIPTGKMNVHGFLKYEWADSEIRARAREDATGRTVIELDDEPKYGVGDRPYFVLRSSLSFLDQDGEYHVADSGEATIISKEAVSDIAVTNSKGGIDFQGVENLTIDGLAFSGFRGYAMRVSGDGIRISNIKIRNIGVTALEAKGRDIVVRDSEFEDIGGMAIKAVGGNRQTLEPGNVVIRNVTVRRVGRLIWSSVPAIRLEGVGNSILDSRIEGAPHAGIFYFGNNHLISGNTLSNVAERTGDVGAIYTGRDLAGRGHKVIGNLITNVQGVGQHRATAIYVDDQSSGVLIENNVIRNSYRGVLVGGGRDNVVKGNTFDNVVECFKGDSRGIGSQREKLAVGGEIRKKLEEVPYRSELYEANYPGISRMLDDRFGLPVGNVVVNNVFTECRWIISREMRENGRFSVQ